MNDEQQPPQPPDDGRPPTLDEIRRWPAVVNVGDSASALGISRSHTYDLINRGEFPVKTITLGSSKRVLTADLIRVLTERQNPNSPPQAN